MRLRPHQRQAIYSTGKPCRRGHLSARYASGSCIECHKENRQKNKEKQSKYIRRWRKDNPQKCKSYRTKAKANGYYKIYYARTREVSIKRAMAWNKSNPTKFKRNKLRYEKKNVVAIKIAATKRRLHNRKKILEQQRKVRAANREKYRAKTRAWRKKYPERARISAINKKARRKAAPGKFTIRDVKSKFEKQKGRCVYCLSNIKTNHAYPVDAHKL